MARITITATMMALLVASVFSAAIDTTTYVPPSMNKTDNLKETIELATDLTTVTAPEEAASADNCNATTSSVFTWAMPSPSCFSRDNLLVIVQLVVMCFSVFSLLGFYFRYLVISTRVKCMQRREEKRQQQELLLRTNSDSGNVNVL